MRCYLVKAVGGKRFAGTVALSKIAHADLMEMFGVKKSAVTISDAEIPMAKAELLEFINGLCKELDSEVSDDGNK